MSRSSRISGDSSFRLSTLLALNVLLVVVVVALRFMLFHTFQRPTLSIPHVGDLSLANWFANRLADVVALIQEILRHLIQWALRYTPLLMR